MYQCRDVWAFLIGTSFVAVICAAGWLRCRRLLLQSKSDLSKSLPVDPALDRLPAEQKLRETVERLLLAEKAARIGIWELDVQRGLITLSDGAAALSGVSGGLALAEIRGSIRPSPSR